LRLSLGGLVSITTAVAVAAALGVGIASLGPDLRAPSTVGRGLGTSDQESEVSDTEGGYTFRYPPGWSLQTDGGVSKVSSPDRAMIVSVGPWPANTLGEVSHSFMAMLDKQYRQVRISSEDSGLGESGATLVSGTLTNQRGLKIRLFAIAINKSGRYYIVSGFSHADIAEDRLESRVREITQSFQTTGAPPAG
jgi:hypothetical protein